MKEVTHIAGHPRRNVPARIRRKRREAKDAPGESQQLDQVAPLGFYTLDRRGEIRELNEQGAKMLGFPAEWLIGRAFVVFVAGADIHRFLDFLTGSIRASEPQLIEIHLAIGKWLHPVQISLVTTVRGSSVSHRLTVVDLYDVQQKEKLFQESLANWYSLVHNAPDAIMTVDAQGQISLLNKPLWGYSITAVIWTNILEYVPDSERPKIRRCLDAAFRLGKRSICEIRGVRGDWNRWYQFSFGSPHTLSLTGESSVVATTTTTLVIREISENKRAEESLRTSGEQLRGFAARLDAVREEERMRMAREIHDELGQALTALKLDLSWLHSKSLPPAKTRTQLKEIIGRVDQTIESVRRISSELRPSILDNLGLVPAIEWQVSEFRKHTRIRAQLVSNVESLDLPVDASIGVFRVVQEALTNVMRHAKASRVQIRLALKNDCLQISIADNGVGMKQNRETGLKSLGIVGMKERISRIHGEFNFISELGKGTRLEITVPVHHD